MHVEEAGGKMVAQDNMPSQGADKASKRSTQFDLGSVVRSAATADQIDVQGSQPPQHPSVRSGVASRAEASIERIQIAFKILERGEWRDVDVLTVDPSDPSHVERVGNKYVRKGIKLYNKNLRVVRPSQCFRTAIEDGTNTVLLISEKNTNINKQLVSSVSEMVDANSGREQRAKRNRH